MQEDNTMQKNAPAIRKARVVVLKTGTTYPDLRAEFGDFDEWFLRGLQRSWRSL